jgi:putative tricarboxylic transport membrane protein
VTPAASITPLRRLQAALPYVVVLAAGLFLYFEADRFEFEHAAGRIGPDAWPKLILGLMLVSALWGLIANFLSAGKAAPQEHDEHEDDEALARPPEIHPFRVWIAVAATLGYLAMLPVIGFFLATCVFSCVLMYLGQFRRPLPVALLSVAIAFSFLFLFMRVVYVALPAGIAPFDSVSYALMAAMGVH